MGNNYTKFFNADPPQLNPTDVSGDSIEINDTPPKAPFETIVINCTRLNIRQEPNKLGNIRCIVNNGDTLLVEDITNGWAHVYTVSGIEGYAMAEYIKEV